MSNTLADSLGVLFIFVLGVGMLVFAHYFNKWQARKHDKKPK